MSSSGSAIVDVHPVSNAAGARGARGAEGGPGLGEPAWRATLTLLLLPPERAENGLLRRLHPLPACVFFCAGFVRFFAIWNTWILGWGEVGVIVGGLTTIQFFVLGFLVACKNHITTAVYGTPLDLHGVPSVPSPINVERPHPRHLHTLFNSKKPPSNKIKT